eukprot:CAMPEP_0198151396 /NCGR_PEP_ID=MMETSP1443-20131203/55525_1 /TAXON_ID=186043 /ORGANISM="Entomoneis sp., Strain CCMP2396" /LENGTH=382 /DNA_ID=CAMNT_0043817043 /DNA_START=121 /DNA_END=1269 /DNA_ORIENTATION=-
MTSTTAASVVKMAPVVVKELQLKCSDGLIVAAQSYRTEQQQQQKQQQQQTLSSSQNHYNQQPLHRILCLHGWMDNCRTFHYLAPALVEGRPNVEVVALDFVGHGLSSHKSLDGTSTVLAESVYHVAEALQQLGWITPQPPPLNKDNNNEQQHTQHQQQITLIGHSMGAGVSCLYSAAFPEQVKKLVLLEGAAPMERNPRDIAKHVRSHVDRRLLLTQSLLEDENQKHKPRRIYPSLEVAVKTRCMTAKNFPGDQWLSTVAATELVMRGIEPVVISSKDDDDDDNNNNASSGFRFRHDARLQWPSCMYVTKEQNNAIYEDISCRTALLLAQNGWPFDEARLNEAIGLMKPGMYETLPGSHHFHADPETASAVAQKVIEFLELE